MSEAQTGPILILTALHHATAKASELTQQHAEAYERASIAIANTPTKSVELVELPIAPAAFEALRKSMRLDPSTVALYDIFAVPSGARPSLLTIAGQYLAAQILWSLDAQGLLGGVPLSLRFSLPQGWEDDKDKIKGRLEKHHLFALSELESQVFKTVKHNWDRAASS